MTVLICVQLSMYNVLQYTTIKQNSNFTNKNHRHI